MTNVEIIIVISVISVLGVLGIAALIGTAISERRDRDEPETWDREITPGQAQRLRAMAKQIGDEQEMLGDLFRIMDRSARARKKMVDMGIRAWEKQDARSHHAQKQSPPVSRRQISGR